MTTEQKKHVLLVDDDPNITGGLGDFLKFRGFDVTTADCAEAGLKKVEGFSPDIVLLDLNMPGIGGFGFLRRIMNDRGDLPYPVLVFTARAGTESFFDDVAVDGFIAKPCNGNELLGKIQEILKKHEKGRRPLVLLAEDETAIVVRLSSELSKAGYAVTVADTGPQALEKATSDKPAVIVIKRIMRGMNGDAIASLLKNIPHTRDIPVIMYDGDTSPGEPTGYGIPNPPASVNRLLATQDTAVIVEAVKQLKAV